MLYPRAFISAVLLMLLSSSIIASPADDVFVTTLPSGMKVIVREGHSINLAAVDIWVGAGSVNETPENNGASHLVEHMIFKATKKYGPGQIDREIEGLGAELNGGTSRDWVHFYTTVASDYLPIALGAIADAIVNAEFRPEDLEKERQVILDEIARSESNPESRAFSLFAQTAFAVHPYRLPPMGTRASVSRLTRDDLVSYHDRYYTPDNIRVVIAGDVSPSSAVDLVQKTFGDLQPSDHRGETIDPPHEPPPASTRLKRFPSLTDQACLVFGYHVTPASEFREVCALDVILALFGDTYRGRISSALNAKGIHYTGINSDFTVQRNPSTFSVLVAADPADIERITPVLVSEFHKLGNTNVPENELAHAKRLVEGGDLFDQETFSGQARALGLYESIASHDLALRYASTVRSITAAEIAAVARKYFNQGNPCVTVVEPKEAQ